MCHGKYEPRTGKGQDCYSRARRDARPPTYWDGGQLGLHVPSVQSLRCSGTEGRYVDLRFTTKSPLTQARAGNLRSQMGFFGGAHFDDGDSGGHYTNMVSDSRLPKTYDQGYFFLLRFGVYIRLENMGGFNFQGNVKHGGSGPFPPDGETPPPHAYRVVCISYPVQGMMNPEGTRYRISGLPNSATYLAPEMRKVEWVPIFIQSQYIC
jgi:hypothetical protein